MYYALGVVAAIALLIVVMVARNKRAWAEAARLRGEPLGSWKVYYDSANKRVGLEASFGEEQLLRMLVFRLHDLLFYYQGMAAEQGRLSGAVKAAATGGQAEWTLLFPPPEAELYHNQERPDAPLRYFFKGVLYEGSVDQPRFVGGDSIAKNEGLVGECIALAGYLAQRQPERVSRAVNALLDAQLDGDLHLSPTFWNRARAALAAAG